MTHGIVHDSVRRAGGGDVCRFRLTPVSLPVQQGNYYEYRRDATAAPRAATIATVNPA